MSDGEIGHVHFEQDFTDGPGETYSQFLESSSQKTPSNDYAAQGLFGNKGSTEKPASHVCTTNAMHKSRVNTQWEPLSPIIFPSEICK
jgi:hypothetical protein